MDNKFKLIALYLPQYHPFKENNEWWGEGFTEWHNVVKARPLFRGHVQPKIPANLGFYDLRLPEVREEQAKMAREAGIEGFCYWHYWFGDGKRLMERPFNEVVETGNPDFPFCLAWANHSWYAKTWDPNKKDRLLIEQRYTGKKDNENHFYALLPAFKDKRYIRIDNKPVFLVFKPLEVKCVREFISQWNDLAKANGLDGIYFIGQGIQSEFDKILDLGYNAVNHEEVNKIHATQSSIVRLWKHVKRKLFKTPRCYDYATAMDLMMAPEDANENIMPTICPNFDHTPRSKRRGLVYTGSTPKTFKKHVDKILEVISNKKNKVAFIKSWNEWGEGNYMEPDEEFGMGYIEALKESLAEHNR